MPIDAEKRKADISKCVAILIQRPRRPVVVGRPMSVHGVRFHGARLMAIFSGFLLLSLLLSARAAPGQTLYSVGVAKQDITPGYPIRLNGFGSRRTESEGVTQPIWAKALAIGADDEHPVVLITLDSLGIRQSMVNEVARRLKQRRGIERSRVTVAFSHSHTAPKVVGACDTIFGVPIPAEHQAHIEKYTAELTDALEAVAMAALADRRPSSLSWGLGRVGFAKNRRPQGGPVDHSLPVLVIRSTENGAIRAIYTTYACHCVTLSNNKISGDWAGFAQRVIESRHPGAIALVSIGCGSDANPDSGVTGDNTAVALDQGTQIADEVDRLLSGTLAPISGGITAKLTQIDLTLNPPPNLDALEKLAAADGPAGFNAKFQLEKLDRGEPLQKQLDYPIQTWEFGDSLAMVFLAGEVCADYSVRLKRELDASRLWLHGYCNDFCAYIPSERLLKEGGYGGGAEVVYFALPNTLAMGLEDKITGQVSKQVSARFRSVVGKPKPASKRIAETQPWPLKRALAAIRTKPGLVVEAVASEPLVADPVAIDFAADGRLWVAEMPDYSRFADEKFQQHGNVRRLTDVDGDGHFDDSTVFADGLRFPTDVKSWRNGVIVCDAPDVIYLEDSNGDGRADIRTILLTGFETHNAQARVNSLRWGLDNWLYGSCGLFGGTIRTATGKEVALGQRDFRFRPDTGEIEPVTGRTQQGRARNDWGDWFGCENASLLDHYPFVDRYFARNPRLSPPASEKSVPQASAVALHPIGPSTLFKLSGPPGRPTSVCGLDFYRDDLLGPEFTNNAFVAEPSNQLVHRLVLFANGATFDGKVADDEQDVEFLASTDPWFRPVQVRTGPDGCLYVVDMHRAVIEHQKFIPQEALQGLDVTAGREEGRIFRVRRRDVAPRPVIDLTGCNTEQLVSLLDTPNGTRRDQIHELLVQRHDGSAVPLLQRLVKESSRDVTRLHALCALEALSGLNPDLLVIALRDQDAGVRRQAVRLCEPWLASSSTLGDELLKHVDDNDPKVRLQLACSLGEWNDLRVAPVLAEMAAANFAEPYVLAGVWSSVDAGSAKGVVHELLQRQEVGKLPPSVLESSIRLALDLGATDDLALISRALAPDPSGAFEVWQLDVATKLVHDVGTVRTTRKCVAPLLAFARRAIEVGTGDVNLRLASLRLMAAATPQNAWTSLLAPSLQPQSPPAIQQGAVELALMEDAPAQMVDMLVAAWPGLSKVARDRAFDAIVARKPYATQFLKRLASGDLAANSLDAAHRQRLVRHADADVRAEAAKALADSISTDREAIVQHYLANMNGPGDCDNGKQLFGKHCASCHVLEGVGHEVGPDLSALSIRTRQGLLESILDPNRAVDDRFRSYTAMTVDGGTYAGILAAETANDVTLIEQQAVKRVLLRADLDSLTMSPLSLMPDGLERELAPTELNDLLAYLMSPNASAKELPATVTQAAAGKIAEVTHQVGPTDTQTVDWSLKLPRIPPLETGEAKSRFSLQPEIQFELVASEPDVVDPVAMAFDESGALYVIEMRDYPEQGNERLGRVRLLTDSNADGVFDKSSVFAEGLSWPTAVCCFGGGVYVAAAPDILYLRDRDHDGAADEREVIFTGLGRSNVQGLVNSFRWGLDNRIYAAVSSSGAKMRHVAVPTGGVLELHGRDFAFDPRTRIAQPTTGGGQHGMCFNRWGDRFVCSNSDHLQAIVFEECYLHRNPYQSPPGARRSIAVDGPQAEVFRTSEVEPWRIVRTKMRVSGFAPGLIEGGGRASGYFTSATGVTVDEGGLSKKSDVLVADVGSNLIHRKRLSPDGVTYRGERIDENSELIASSDNWFRPVQMCLGPEGAIYVADMYREVIEHPKSLPPQIKTQLDLTSGRDRGRIYRIVPAGYHYKPPRPMQHATIAELADELEDANMWRRLTAARLLFERQDKSIAPLLQTRFAATKDPVTRITILYVLAGQAALSNELLLASLGDAHPQVRRHGLRLAESRFDDVPALLAKARELAEDPQVSVRFQLALSLGVCESANVTDILAKLVQEAENGDVVAAAVVSAHSNAGAMLQAVMKDATYRDGPVGRKVVAALIGQIKLQQRPEDIESLRKLLTPPVPPSLSAVAVLATTTLGPLDNADQQTTTGDAMAALASAQQRTLHAVLPLAISTLRSPAATAEQRVTAVRLLALGDLQSSEGLLVDQLADTGSDRLPQTVISAVAQRQSPIVARILLAAWNRMSTEVRSSAASVLCSRSAWATQLLDACDQKQIQFSELPPTCATTLCNFPDDTIRQRAQQLRGESVPADRQLAFRDYREVLEQSGDATKGKGVFVQHCSDCHQVEGRGYAIGPNLTSMVSRGNEGLLYNILVPNAEIDPRFASSTIVTNNGRVVSGVIAAESVSSVTLKGPKGEITTVLRVDIDEMFNSNISLMPDGLEKSIDKAGMADLLAYLRQSASKRKDANP